MNDSFGDLFCRSQDLGKPIPDTEHAVSVCLPLWEHNIGYEKAVPAVINQMRCGYPRFFLHPAVKALFQRCAEQWATGEECCFAFPSRHVAERCVEFLRRETGAQAAIHDLKFLDVHAVCLPKSAEATAMAYWQHTGEIVSSRLARAILEQHLPSDLGESKKQRVRTRVADLTGADTDDVYLFPNGMAAIFTAYRMLQATRPNQRSIQFGFPYVDILKIQQRFSEFSGQTPGTTDGVCLYPLGSEEELIELEHVIAAEKVCGLFCEFPGNPLLRSPDLVRLSELANRFKFPLVVDDTLGAFINVETLPVADVLVTSLTKFFSGQGDVMGGSLVLNRRKPFYDAFRAFLEREFEDYLFGEDAAVLERNSRDCVERVRRINHNTEQLCEFLRNHPAVEHVYHPKYETAENYRDFMRTDAGYGGLLSFTLREAAEHAPRVFDRLRVAKGPNLGMNYSLCCPYTILAHYKELDFAERCGVSRYLIRVSAGMEEAGWIVSRFAEALNAVLP